MEITTENKKIGRPLVSEKFGAMDSKTRQARARSFAMKDLWDGNEKDVSNSMLVAMLPKLISEKHNHLIERVCDELKSRFT